MQLKIQRSQRTGLTGKVLFCVDMRADYSLSERSNINRYTLGGQNIYSSKAAQRHLEHAGTHLDRTQSGGTGERLGGLARGALSLAMAKMSLNITIASLGRGHHIECKDLPEMLEAEETVRDACKSLTRYLDVAATFDGGETVIEYVNGEERVHVMESAPPLLEYDQGQTGVAVATASDDAHAHTLAAPVGGPLAPAWQSYETKVIAFFQKRDLLIGPIGVRLGTVVAAFLVLYILIKIF